ncbi:MAG: hypothetical protein AAFX56_09775 [Pseudomonadota bacterium]
MDRRSVVFLVGALAVAPRLGLAEPVRTSQDRIPALLRALAQSISADAGKIGEQYLRDTPAESGLSTLVRLLFPEPRLLSNDSRDEQYRFLSDTRRQDFELGRTVEVGKAIFSRTEARMLAALSLVAAFADDR